MTPDKQDILSEAELGAYLAAPTPLAFWRHHRGFTQASLAALIQLSEAEIAQIETGQSVGDMQLYARIAEVLRIRMEDILPD